MTVSWKNKLVGAVATGAIVAGLFPMAALGAGALTADTSITVGGLDEGDTANFYRIVEQDVDAYEKATVFVAQTTYYEKDGDSYVETEDTVTADNVTDYYVLKNGSQAWKLTKAVDKNGDGFVDGTVTGEAPNLQGLTVDDLVITKDPDELTADDKKVITYEMANQLAAALQNNVPDDATAVTYTDEADSDGKVTINTDGRPTPGIYMVFAVPGPNNINTVYKPIFVSADYYQFNPASDDTNTITLVADPAAEGSVATDYLTPVAGMFKRSNLDVDKFSGKYTNGQTTDTQHDISVGDTVDFSFTTNVPTFSENYIDAKFELTDVITKGLKLVDKEGKYTNLDKIAENIVVEIEDGYEELKLGTDYTVTVTNDQTFKITFLNDDPKTDGEKDGFLYKVMGSPKITVKYQAVVTDDAANINQMDNTVKLEFSKDPTWNPNDGNPDTPNEPPTSELKDKTRHYTFNIDADIFGQEEIPGEAETPGGDKNKTSELRKVSLEASDTLDNATPETSTLPKKPTDYEWLQGAEFELKQTKVYTATDSNADGQNDSYSFVDVAPNTLVKFDSSTHIKKAKNNGGTNPESDADGYITMKGLDAGVYILREVRAPLGYTYDPAISYKITITPEYVTEGASSTDPDDKNEILKSYTITIVKQEDGEDTDQVATSTYTAGVDDNDTPISFLNESFDEDGNPVIDPGINSAENSGVSITLSESSLTTLIENKKLGLLPATGGSGIIFYLGVGGAVALVASYLLKNTKEENPLA